MKRTLWTLALGTALLATAAGAVACGDDDDDDGGAPAVTRPAGAASPAGQATSAAATEPGGEAEDGALTVTATEFQFAPAALTIAGGEATVSFVNAGSAPHTFTVYADAEFTEPIDGGDSGRISGGGEAEVALQLTGAGERYFRCEVHPAQMQGSITVE